MITLYKKAKSGKIQVYHSWTEGAELFSKFGAVHGKMQTTSIICTGKNIGRSNETTPEEQAKLEMASKCQLKRDKGYFDTAEEAKTEEVFLPMLAKDGRKVKISYPCDAQPKLDGVRCMAKGKELMSRGGKPWNVKHVSDAIPVTIPESVLDGELYIHDNSLQDTVSKVKKPKAGSEAVEYWVYDLYIPGLPSMPWSRRKNYLENLQLTLPLKVVPTYRVHNEVEMKTLHDRFVQAGYEGIILRTDTGVYELAQRSGSLIKYKEFIDEEFEIVGYKEGKGRFVGCVIWKCKNAHGTFDVVPKGTLEKKKEWFNNADSIVGEKLTVRYQTLTDKGLPQFPVGIVIRDYE